MRELRLYNRRRMDVVNAMIFFLLVIIMFPIGVGPEPEILRTLSYGVIWVAAIFASTFGLRAILEPDYEDGTLNQYLTLPHRLEIIMLAKIAANWVAYCLPVVVISPLAAAMFGFSFSESWVLVLALLLATPIFVMIGAIGSALSLGAKKGRVLLLLLVMPLYIPVLIFGVNTSYIFLENVEGDYVANLMILFGLLLLAIPLSSFATAKSVDAA